MLAIHGGAGNFGRKDVSREQETESREDLRRALLAGKRELDRGGSCVDAVEAAIVTMEESPWFNAGRGAVFTHDESHELDASMMHGAGQRAGAVAGLQRIRNPIRAARAVLEASEHVLLSGPGAESFAREQGLECVAPEFFSTERRREQLHSARRSGAARIDHESAPADDEDNKFGTVGAVARDVRGHLAAGTSTGGMTNKRYSRIGDSAIIGAGTFADSRVAISCTGHGEYFIRYAVAHEIAARVRLCGLSLEQAATDTVRDLHRAGGAGGVIAIDAAGRTSLPMNTTGMYRGWVDERGEVHVAIFADEASA